MNEWVAEGVAFDPHDFYLPYIIATAYIVKTSKVRRVRYHVTEILHSPPRYSTRDHWIQESIKRIFNSGLFWAVGAAEREKKFKLP